MKCVSISTADRRWLLSNYGGFLQHFALRVVLERLGYAPYRIETGRKRGEAKAFIQPLRVVANNLLAFFDKRRGRRPVKPLWFWLHRIRFILDYRKLIGNLFEKSVCERYAAIVGGGQAWSIYCQDRPDLYWEDDDRSMKRIAYSVSSAWIALANNEEWKKRLACACRKADAVALREKAGAELCASIAPGREYAVALDPVFLLTAEDYCSRIPKRRIFGRKTMLCYFVEVYDSEYIDARKLTNLADGLDCQCRMTGIQGAEFFIPHKLTMNPGPIDFLRCCRDADYIVTNSFHGVVLAIVFGKKFLFVGQRDPQNTGGRNQRQAELLAEFGLMERFVPVETDCKTMQNAMRCKINWDEVQKNVSRKRKYSIDWLKRALQSGSSKLDD